MRENRYTISKIKIIYDRCQFNKMISGNHVIVLYKENHDIISYLQDLPKRQYTAEEYKELKKNMLEQERSMTYLGVC